MNNFTVWFFMKITFNDKPAMFRIKIHCAVFRTRTCLCDNCDKSAKNETSVTIVDLSVLSFHIFYSLTMLFLFSRFLHFWLHDIWNTLYLLFSLPLPSFLGVTIGHLPLPLFCSIVCCKQNLCTVPLIIKFGSVWWSPLEVCIRQRALQSLRSGEPVGWKGECLFNECWMNIMLIWDLFPFSSVITLRIPISSVALRSDTSAAHSEYFSWNNLYIEWNEFLFEFSYLTTPLRRKTHHNTLLSHTVRCVCHLFVGSFTR